MMENPYDREIKRIVESLEANGKERERIEGRLAELKKELSEIPKQKGQKRKWVKAETKRISTEINGVSFELDMVGYRIGLLSGDLEKAEKKREILEYVRGEK
ncbi:MAG: hypothetical protein M1344_03550 [Candidatus Thermoplasmatota archaeon]|nr:hypothetical protein [Candidatus Thermoplasmatota archaeon]